MNILKYRGKALFVLYAIAGLSVFAILSDRAPSLQSPADNYTEYPLARVTINAHKDSFYTPKQPDDQLLLDIQSEGLEDVVVAVIKPSTTAQIDEIYLDENSNGLVDELDTALKFGRSRRGNVNLGYVINNTAVESPGAPLIPYWFPPTNTRLIVRYSGEMNLGDFTFEVENARTKEAIDYSFVASDFSGKQGLLDVKKTPAAFVEENPNLRAELNGSTVTIPAGNYQIEATTIVPETVTLVLQPGVNITIVKDVSLVSYGKVIAEGTADVPITVDSLKEGENFGVFALLNERAADSSFKHFKIANGSETRLNGVFLSGMFSAYHVERIHIASSVFEGSSSDDGVNVKYADVILEDSLLINNSADALDLDFASGEIRRNSFLDNGNDSIDTSQTTVLITENNIQRSGDKCMSFGENSNPVAINNILNGCFIGVEIKDKSTPVIANNLISNSTKSGINSYQKKEFFAGGVGNFLYNVFTSNAKDIDFNNSFTGTKLATDESFVRMRFNVFDLGSNVEEYLGQDQCRDCEGNSLQSIELNDASELIGAADISLEEIRSFTKKYQYTDMKTGYNEQ